MSVADLDLPSPPAEPSPAVESFEPSEALRTASKLRVPVFERGTPAHEKLEQLEDFMLQSAWHSGECSEERLDWHARLSKANEEWDFMPGWEHFHRGKLTKDQAKARCRPDLHRAIRLARWHVHRLGEEIERLERDAKQVSRAYTILSGGLT